jgi:hypothetical protein
VSLPCWRPSWPGLKFSFLPRWRETRAASPGELRSTAAGNRHGREG